MKRPLPYTKTVALGALAAISGCIDQAEVIDVEGARPFIVTIENTAADRPVTRSGAFDTAVEADAPGAIGPGESFRVQFDANPRDRLSFATMFVESNDLFYAPLGEGIRLFNAEGDPLTGDITPLVLLWDAGTEVNEQPGEGENQAPRQADPDAGMPEDSVVTVVEGQDAAGFSYPPVEEVLQASLEHEGNDRFTLTIENVSNEDTLATGPVPLSPGVFAVHRDGFDLFEVDEPAPEYLEALAESGAVEPYVQRLDDLTGSSIVLNPGAWAVHDRGLDLVEEGERSSDLLSDLDDVTAVGLLAEAWFRTPGVEGAGIFDTEVGSAFDRTIGPTESTSFTVFAEPLDVLTIAASFDTTDDTFVSFSGVGAPFFVEADGDITGEVDELLPFAGDVSPRLELFRADEDGRVTLVDDQEGFVMPQEALRITIVPSAN